MKPLDTELNAAVLAIAREVLPDGWDTSAEAPETLEALQAHYQRTGRLLVSNAASERTIYGKPSVNFAFRAWHDWTHLQGPYDLTLEGETAAAEAQCRHLAQYVRDHAELKIPKGKLRAWQDIVRAEIIGQARYQAAQGAFPSDQFAFVQAYLAQPSAALSATF